VFLDFLAPFRRCASAGLSAISPRCAAG